MINTKEFFLRSQDDPSFEFKSLIHPILSVPENMPVNTLLKKLQLNQTHIAILVDEYGGTSGMVTIEDILEEIVGEIRDEFDTEERKEIEIMNDHHIIVDGKVSLTYVDELLHTELKNEDHDADTIGGWLYGLNPELKKGMDWKYQDLTFRVIENDKHRIRKIDITRYQGTEDTPDE